MSNPNNSSLTDNSYADVQDLKSVFGLALIYFEVQLLIEQTESVYSSLVFYKRICDVWDEENRGSGALW